MGRRGGWPKENDVQGNYPGRGQMCGGPGAIVRFPFKVLHYDDLVGGVVSGYVTKIAGKPFYPPWPTTPAICKLHGSIFY